MSDFSAIIDTNFVLIIFHYILGFFWSNTLFRYQTWISSYPSPFIRTQRFQISQYFEIGPLFPDFGGDVLHDVPSTHVDKFRLLHSGYLSFSQIICEFSIAFFLTLLTLDNYRYQTHERNITKFYLLIPNHLIIQLTKLQVCILNMSTTFWHCRKNFDYFWTRVRRWLSTKLQHLQCVSNGDTAVLHQAIDACVNVTVVESVCSRSVVVMCDIYQSDHLWLRPYLQDLWLLHAGSAQGIKFQCATWVW